jgi:ferredoxin
LPDNNKRNEGNNMRVIIDQDKFVASGQCVLAAAEVFDQHDEDGIVVLLKDNPPAELAEDARQARCGLPGTIDES